MPSVPPIVGSCPVCRSEPCLSTCDLRFLRAIRAEIEREAEDIAIYKRRKVREEGFEFIGPGTFAERVVARMREGGKS